METATNYKITTTTKDCKQAWEGIFPNADWEAMVNAEQYHAKKEEGYCTQNNFDCNTCSLKNYGYDCRGNKITQ